MSSVVLNAPTVATKRVRVAIVGFGTVGTGVWRILRERAAVYETQFGLALDVAGIGIRDAQKTRDVDTPVELLTTDVQSLLDDDETEIIVELTGDRFAAEAMIEDALCAGKHVVTANKLVLAHLLPRLLRLAERRGVGLLYSASVCGSIPILRALDERRMTDTVTSIRGIVNGSTNFILTQMTEHAMAYDDACALAREQGFLEADPWLDVSGEDARQKLSILTYHAFGRQLPPESIATSGIASVSQADIASAAMRGGVLKLIAEARCDADASIAASVRVEELPAQHLLAQTRNEFNAVHIETKHAGPQLLYGKGAGSLPTASAVVRDLVGLLETAY